MKILSNCKVTKLKEYSQSYGGKEVIEVPFIKVFEKEIHLLTHAGGVSRVMRRNTKVLIDWTGEEITERAFKMRTKKQLAANALAYEVKKAADLEVQTKNKELSDQQSKDWREFLNSKTEQRAKYLSKVNSMPSSKWRNLLRLAACKHLNIDFADLQISAPELKSILIENQ